jgi:hypothetical protein
MYTAGKDYYGFGIRPSREQLDISKPVAEIEKVPDGPSWKELPDKVGWWYRQASG